MAQYVSYTPRTALKEAWRGGDFKNNNGYGWCKLRVSDSSCIDVEWEPVMGNHCYRVVIRRENGGSVLGSDIVDLGRICHWMDV